MGCFDRSAIRPPEEVIYDPLGEPWRLAFLGALILESPELDSTVPCYLCGRRVKMFMISSGANPEPWFLQGCAHLSESLPFRLLAILSFYSIASHLPVLGPRRGFALFLRITALYHSASLI